MDMVKHWKIRGCRFCETKTRGRVAYSPSILELLTTKEGTKDEAST